MTKPSVTPSHTYKLQLQCVQDSDRWFGDQGTHQSIPHQVLAMCGEVGEVANLIKKIERGSLDIRDAKTRNELAMELADVYTYLLMIGGMLHLDIERAYEVKRIYNQERFSKERTARDLEKLRNGSHSPDQ